MKQLLIRRCPTTPNIKALANQIAEVLHDDPDLNIYIVDGDIGEFTMKTNGRLISEKVGDYLPSFIDAVEAVLDDVPLLPVAIAQRFACCGRLATL